MKKQANTTHFFYQNGKLVTVNQGGLHQAIFRSTDIPLAELSTGERQETGLLEVDQNGSVLKVSGNADKEEPHCYSAYGHNPHVPSARTLAGFNGEHMEAIAVGYLLGNGYRLFNPALMRFHSPDSISPFGEGGLNSYCYCLDDPVNRTDPDGHWSLFKPRTWFRSRAQKIEQRVRVAKKLAPIVEELTTEINKLNKGYTDLLRKNASDKLERSLKPLAKRLKRKVDGANKYVTDDNKYFFKEIDMANEILNPESQYRPPVKQKDSGLFRESRRKHDPYDDANYQDKVITPVAMASTRRT